MTVDEHRKKEIRMHPFDQIRHIFLVCILDGNITATFQTLRYGSKCLSSISDLWKSWPLASEKPPPVKEAPTVSCQGDYPLEGSHRTCVRLVRERKGIHNA